MLEADGPKWSWKLRSGDFVVQLECVRRVLLVIYTSFLKDRLPPKPEDHAQ